MDKEYYFLTDDGHEIISDSLAEAEIMAEYYEIDWLKIKSRDVFVDCAVRDGNT